MKRDVSLHSMMNPCKNKRKKIYDCLTSEDNKGRSDRSAERVSIGCECVWLQRKRKEKKRNEETKNVEWTTTYVLFEYHHVVSMLF